MEIILMTDYEQYIAHQIEDKVLKKQEKRRKRFNRPEQKDYAFNWRGDIDSQTKKSLTALLNKGIISEIKELFEVQKDFDVYIAHAGEEAPEAYPSIVVIKTFRPTAHTKKARKEAVKMAEFEFNRMKAMSKTGIPCPQPILVKGNVIVMEAIQLFGKKIREVENCDWNSLYPVIAAVMNNLYQKFGLILSERNIVVLDEGITIVSPTQMKRVQDDDAEESLEKIVRKIQKLFEETEVETIPEHDFIKFVVDSELANARKSFNRLWKGESDHEDDSDQSFEEMDEPKEKVCDPTIIRHNFSKEEWKDIHHQIKRAQKERRQAYN